jgi:hypothetical protein
VTLAPVAHETFKPAHVADAAPAERGGWTDLTGTPGEKLSERRTFTDLTVDPAYAHAADYSWLVGELRSLGPGVWAVRFASVDEDRDTVVLVDAPAMVDLRAGQLVRVEGQLVDPASHEARPAYRVSSIRPVEKE